MHWITRGLNLKRIFLYNVCTLEGGRPVRVLSVHPFVCLSVCHRLNLFFRAIMMRWIRTTWAFPWDWGGRGMLCLPTCQRYSSFMISELHIWSHNSFSTSLLPRSLSEKFSIFPKGIWAWDYFSTSPWGNRKLLIRTRWDQIAEMFR